MKTKVFFILSALLLIVTSCSESKIENELEELNLDNSDGVSADVGVYISVIDINGVDLLNPNNSYINFEEVKVYHNIDGELVEYYVGHLDNPRGIRLIPPDAHIFEEPYLFSLVEATRPYNTNKIDEFNTAYIQWNEIDMDTIRSQIERRGSIIQSIRFWANGKLVYDYYDDNYEKEFRIIHIVKSL